MKPRRMAGLRRAWMRFERMDEQWREFSQPYFKSKCHPVIAPGSGRTG